MFLSDCFFLAQCYFPASGYRRRETGIFFGVGTEGDSWSASAAGIESTWGTYLRFVQGDIGPMYSHCRAYAFAVRCVQAFT